MKFELLTSKKNDLNFKERVLFMNERGEWWDGFLKEKKESIEGTKFIVTIWNRQLGEQEETDTATHFMRITTPKDKD